MTSLHVICGLGLPNQKFWLRLSTGDCLKNFFEDLFLGGERLRLCPWSLVLASSIPVLGLESVCPRKGCPWPWHRIFFESLALASSLVSSTPPLIVSDKIIKFRLKCIKHLPLSSILPKQFNYGFKATLLVFVGVFFALPLITSFYVN